MPNHDKSSHEGNAVENVTTQFGLQQKIKEPNTHQTLHHLVLT